MALSRPAGTKDSHNGDIPRSIKLTICAEPQLRQLGPPEALSAAQVSFSRTPISPSSLIPLHQVRRRARSLPSSVKKNSFNIVRRLIGALSQRLAPGF